MKKVLKYCFNTNKWAPTKTEWINLLCSLPKDERERIARYMFKQDCKQTLIGQILVRYCLKNLLNLKWNHISIARDGKSRPFLNLTETAKLSNVKTVKNAITDFNLSHSGDYAAIVTGLVLNTSSSTNEASNGNMFKIGTDMMKIDIERSKLANPDESNIYNLYESELSRYARIIGSKFGEAEQSYINSRSNAIEKLTAFYRLWCLKESYVKAIGDGLTFDVRRIECQISSDLFIDLNSVGANRNKCLVVNNTQILVDAKPVKTCKFYEQYFLNRIETNLNHLSELYILTFCILENEAAAASSNTDELLEEFKEISLSDIMSSVVPLEQMNPVNSLDFEKDWSEFCEKTEKPLPATPNAR